MTLAVAVPLGIVSAVAYGAAAAVQHDAVGQGEDGHRPVRELLRDARWWASIGGDSVGLVLQLAALAFGPVVLVQPLFVLCLPVALPIRALFGGPRPTRADYVASFALAVGLAGFFAIAGSPAGAHALAASTGVVLAATALVAGGAVSLLARGLPATAKAITLSAVAGLWFGVEAVFVNVVSTEFDRHSFGAFATAPGLVATAGAVVLGLLGFALSQVAFRAGNLAASFPAMLVCDPLIAVVLGALLLHETVRGAPLAVVGYLACLAVIVAATLRLAAPAGSARSQSEPTEPAPSS
jgi:hypothetical protein